MSPSGVKKQSPKMSSRLRVAGVPREETACRVWAERGGAEKVGAWMSWGMPLLELKFAMICCFALMVMQY